MISEHISTWLLIYLSALNLVGFVSMGIDKHKSKNKLWRVPEARLFGIAILGGSIGSILGMRTFRHKTKHTSFTIGMPVILLLQMAAAAGYFIVFRP